MIYAQDPAGFAWQKRIEANAAARLWAACPLLVPAVYLYGPRPLVLCAVALVTALVCDMLAAAMRTRRWRWQDASSPLFALLLVCMLPASVSYYTVIIAVASGILIGKQLFGGLGSYPFHPAAVGYLVAAVSWPQQVLTFPAPGTRLPLEDTFSFAAQEAPAQTLRLGGLPNMSSVDMVLGDFAGPMGVTSVLLVLACALTMAAVRRFDVAAPLGFSGMCVLLVWILPRVAGVRFGELLRMELTVSGLAFGAAFLLQDETTAPRRWPARLVYGALAGLFAMAYQYYGPYPYGVCMGVLCANALSGMLDHIDSAARLGARRLWQRLRRHKEPALSAAAPQNAPPREG